MSISMEDYLIAQKWHVTQAAQDIMKALDGGPITEASLATAIHESLPDESAEVCSQISRGILEGAQEGCMLEKCVAANIAVGGTGNRVVLTDQLDSLPEEQHRPYLLVLYLFLAAHYGFSVSEEQTAYLSQLPMSELQDKVVVLADAFSDEFAEAHVQNADDELTKAFQKLISAPEVDCGTYSEEEQAQIASAAVYVAGRKNPGQSIDLNYASVKHVSKQAAFRCRAGEALSKHGLYAIGFFFLFTGLVFCGICMDLFSDFVLASLFGAHMAPILACVIGAPILLAAGAILSVALTVALYHAFQFLDRVEESLPSVERSFLPNTRGVRLLHTDLNAANAWAEAQQPGGESDFALDIDEEFDESVWQEREDDLESGLLPV